ncbi:NADP-dependent oxidoreductase domain-containing protein [Flagelloscypha sp. PMI_526]|nr:NADP-dependent oxidoreductase domain-containing protein [Flagelloscypha sp. PMI_526]
MQTTTPLAKTALGVYRLLSPRAGVHVSPLALGAMTIGDQWQSLGKMNKDSSFKLLDAYFDAGGNFIDTANNYQNGSSESFIGEWAESRQIRDQLVIATKYTTPFMGTNPDVKQNILYTGNSTKSMMLGIEESLKRLRTSYIDIFYVHWWDHVTSIEEMMNSLHNLVQSGKVLYLGISDTPAWVANQYARDHGKTPFVIYQGQWNVLERDMERDIISMAVAENMAIAPWGITMAGKLRSPAETKRREAEGDNRTMFGDWKQTEDQVKMSEVLGEIANEVGVDSIPAIAIAWVMHRAPFVFPIIGGRKVEHLNDNIKALRVKLTKEHIARIEAVKPFSRGFPYHIFGDEYGYNPFFLAAGPVAKIKVSPTPVPHDQDWDKVQP